jgi:D-erythronate 2-dehydrogenase
MDAKRSVVTGAAGFIGAGLCAALHRRAAGAGGAFELCATDRDAAGAADAPPLLRGDIADPVLIDALFERPVHALFHLAGIVSGRAEADFALGKRVNLDATLALLERCRRQAGQGGPVVRFVFASSIAVFGTPLPARFNDATPPQPSLSYGTHKRVIELLLDDDSRRGSIDGRALRLPGVLLRPAAPNGALSAFNSDLVREPLAGRDYVCPVGPDATLWVTSRRCAVRHLLALAAADASELGARRSITAPALALRVADLVAALGAIDSAAPARVQYRPQAAIEAQFGRWPLECSFERANALGLHAEASIEALLENCLQPG